jgi:hypothetical protein
MGARTDIRLLSASGDIEIQLRPAPGSAAERDASVRELRRLVYDFKYRDPQARRAVAAILADLRGTSPSAVVHELEQLDAGSPRAYAFGEELLSAGRLGRIVARRVETRSIVVPLEGPAEPVLGPDSWKDAAPASKSWIGLVLLDEDGTPVPNRPYRVIQPDGTQVDGTLDSNGSAIVNGIVPGNCQIWCPYVEPHPATTYSVTPGDHISGIAQGFGFDDFNTVWSDPDNTDLSQQRPDPHVLQPGDTVAIPEVTAQPGANKPTTAKHPFQINRSPLNLRLTILGLDGKPLTNAHVAVAGTSLTTDGNGLVQAAIDKSATGSTFDDPQGNEVDLLVGGLNPSEDTSDAGYKARLYNMGFLWDTSVADTDDEMIVALQDFQAQYSLTVSGQLDDATKAQLLQSYGS